MRQLPSVVDACLPALIAWAKAHGSVKELWLFGSQATGKVERAAPDRTVAKLRDIFAMGGQLYDRGVPVRLVYDQMQQGVVAQPVTPDILVLMAHEVSRPFSIKEKKGDFIDVDVCFPRPFATMYRDWRGNWNLPALNGIGAAPLLDDTGGIRSGEGYDAETGIWCEKVPDLSGLVPERPTLAEAVAALRHLRERFRTFCFADAVMVEIDGVMMVDINRPPGKDESAFLVALLTAIARPSLKLAPGVLIRAAPMSGAGAGKGLLARSIAEVAFGRQPHAVTSGSTLEELEKRISAELMGGSPMVFLDNLNNTAFKSDLLASAITENPARVRVLGRSQMVPLNATAFIVLTGNGLTVTEDLVRRFVTVELDPRTEDPEARHFPNDILLDLRRDRARLLAAALTIWRWGRLEIDLPCGRPMGSFETWSRWVRDPLLALGCRDPAERLDETKERDARRQATAELFEAWWKHHGDRAMALRDLDEHVLRLVDPQKRGRQFVAAQVGKLAGTRLAGLVLARQPPPGRWGVTTYQMRSAVGGSENHGHHRGHRVEVSSDAPHAPDADHGAASSPADEPLARDPMPPMVPMLLPAGDENECGQGNNRRNPTAATTTRAAATTGPTVATAATVAIGIRVKVDGDRLILTAASARVEGLLGQHQHKKAELAEYLRGLTGWTEDDWQALFDERAGIIEFDGGQSRAEAEAQTKVEVDALRELVGVDPAGSVHNSDKTLDGTRENVTGAERMGLAPLGEEEEEGIPEFLDRSKHPRPGDPLWSPPIESSKANTTTQE